MRVPLYLVGGPLRDLLLDRPLIDIDIAVEGDAMALATELATLVTKQKTPRSARPKPPPSVRAEPVEAAAATTPAPGVVTHPRFGTATVRIPGHHIDLVTARSETYARPGALPTVRPATIEEDLLRRDFTINALALRLSSPRRGEIIDPTGGRRDLDARLIRVLHEHSFQDDATRILRGFRYATRLGFEIEPETLACIDRDLRYLDTISGARLHHEFARISRRGCARGNPPPSRRGRRPHRHQPRPSLRARAHRSLRPPPQPPPDRRPLPPTGPSSPGISPKPKPQMSPAASRSRAHNVPPSKQCLRSIGS